MKDKSAKHSSSNKSSASYKNIKQKDSNYFTSEIYSEQSKAVFSSR
jgi:hypothetical protein